MPSIPQKCISSMSGRFHCTMTPQRKVATLWKTVPYEIEPQSPCIILPRNFWVDHDSSNDSLLCWFHEESECEKKMKYQLITLSLWLTGPVARVFVSGLGVRWELLDSQWETLFFCYSFGGSKSHKIVNQQHYRDPAQKIILMENYFNNMHWKWLT